MQKLAPKEICLNVAALLKAERERREWSLSAVAERAGLSYQMIAFVERGQRTPTIDSFVRIAGALGLDPGKTLSKAQKLRK